MGSFYSGFGGHKTYLGHCEGGIIYKGSGMSTPVGRYEGGSIYNQFKEHVGSYSGGSVYDAFGTHVASYDGGVIYNTYLNVAVGKEQIGSYDTDPAEAAAMVLLFGKGGSEAESAQSEHGLNGLFQLISTLFNLILIILRPVLVYYLIPGWCGYTLYGAVFILLLFFGIPIIPVCLLACFVCISSIPYWVILFIQKHKQKLSWADVTPYYFKWLFIGPFAYPAIFELKNRNK